MIETLLRGNKGLRYAFMLTFFTQKTIIFNKCLVLTQVFSGIRYKAYSKMKSEPNAIIVKYNLIYASVGKVIENNEVTHHLPGYFLVGRKQGGK